MHVAPFFTVCKEAQSLRRCAARNFAHCSCTLPAASQGKEKVYVSELRISQMKLVRSIYVNTAKRRVFPK